MKVILPRSGDWHVAFHRGSGGEVDALQLAAATAPTPAPRPWAPTPVAPEPWLTPAEEALCRVLRASAAPGWTNEINDIRRRAVRRERAVGDLIASGTPTSARVPGDLARHAIRRRVADLVYRVVDHRPAAVRRARVAALRARVDALTPPPNGARRAAAGSHRRAVPIPGGRST